MKFDILNLTYLLISICGPKKKILRLRRSQEFFYRYLGTGVEVVKVAIWPR